MIGTLSNRSLCVYFTVLTLFSLYSPEKLVNEYLDPIIVATPSGLIRGAREQEHVSFYGIPYARPPLGDLRFKSPEPYPVPWEGVLQGGRGFSPKCPQKTSSAKPSDWSGNEDCLYLNVFSSKSAGLMRQNGDEEPSKLPVMVWIHGGNFNKGSIADYDPTYFMSKGVVLVIIAFRLGPLGFLNLEKDYAKGNQAVEDQTLALSWIHKNIKSFGGDPNKITIFGESSGAKSVMHLITNPKARKYFGSAIIQSGVIDWTPDLTEDSQKAMHEVWSKEIGCDRSRDLETCLINVPLNRIMESPIFQCACNLKAPGHPFPNPWTPQLKTRNPFSSDDPPKMIEGLNVLIGMTSNEGYLATSRLMLQNKETEAFLANWEECLEMNTGVDDIEPIMEHYFGGLEKPNLPAQIQNLTNIISDFWYTGPTMKTIQFLSDAGSPPYFYMFDHDGFVSMTDHISRTSLDYWYYLVQYGLGLKPGRAEGASHADELRFMFREFPLNLLQRPADQDMVRLMVDLWTDFAHHGNPNGKKQSNHVWEPASERNLYKYARLKNGNIYLPSSEEMKTLHDKVRFWESIVMEDSEIDIK